MPSAKSPASKKTSPSQSKLPALSSWASLGKYLPAVEKRITALRDQNFAARFWSKDATLWSDDPPTVRSINNRLGWLSVLQSMRADCRILRAFTEEVRQAGYTHALLLGMGGSSLCPEVCRQTFGVAPGFLDLAVLDSTDPVAVRAAERRAPLDKTLFIVATKSGTTTETLCFYRYFYEKVRELAGDNAGKHFVAITDPGSPLVALGAEKHFRRTFLNPSDIGGRYSALSYFGLVPAALLGIQIESLIERAAALLPGPASGAQIDDHPALLLGAILGQLALEGRDKLTFALSREIGSFGYWVEQLIAESTGKQGKGLFPVDRELLGRPSVYGSDRVFVHMRLAGSRDSEATRELADLAKAGHPVIQIELADKLDMGKEFLRWEIVTAVAAAVCHVNAFDEPNVKESKDNTERILKGITPNGKLAEEAPIARSKTISLFAAHPLAQPASNKARPSKAKADAVQENLTALLQQAKPGDYVAILAYLPPSAAADKQFARLRTLLRDGLRIATSAGYGPRYLHSTGQFHKGGPASGLFVEITVKDPLDLPIPELPYSFGTLKQAQARGDREALESRGRRFLRVHLDTKPETGLSQLVRRVEKALL